MFIECNSIKLKKTNLPPNYDKKFCISFRNKNYFFLDIFFLDDFFKVVLER